MKKLFILLSILFAFIGCKNSVSTPNYEDDNGGSQVSSGLNTSLPTWNVNYSPIPKEYWGKYYRDDDNRYLATVTDRDINIYEKDYYGNFRIWKYYHVFDKNAEYLGDNTWRYPPFYGVVESIDKYKSDFRYSLAFPDIIRFERNEKGQRVLEDKFNTHYIYEDDVSK